MFSWSLTFSGLEVGCQKPKFNMSGESVESQDSSLSLVFLRPIKFLQPFYIFSIFSTALQTYRAKWAFKLLTEFPENWQKKIESSVCFHRSSVIGVGLPRDKQVWFFLIQLGTPRPSQKKRMKQGDVSSYVSVFYLFSGT